MNDIVKYLIWYLEQEGLFFNSQILMDTYFILSLKLELSFHKKKAVFMVPYFRLNCPPNRN